MHLDCDLNKKRYVCFGINYSKTPLQNPTVNSFGY